MPPAPYVALHWNAALRGERKEAVLAWVKAAARRAGGPEPARCDEDRSPPTDPGPARGRPGQGGARREALPRPPALRRQHDLLRVLPRPGEGRHRPAGRLRRHPRPDGRDQLPHHLQRRPQLRAVLGRPRGDARGPGGRPAQQPDRDGLQLDADHGEARQGQGLREGVHGRLPRGHQQDHGHPRDRRVRTDAAHPELEVRQVPQGRRRPRSPRTRSTATQSSRRRAAPPATWASCSAGSRTR